MAEKFASQPRGPKKNAFEALDPPEGWESFPTLTSTATRLNITRFKLGKLVQQGGLRMYKGADRNGGYRIHPDDVELLESQLDEAAAEAVEEDDDQPLPPSTGDAVKASVDGMKQAQAHVERLITLLEQPMRATIKTLQEENAELRTENSKLREERRATEAERVALTLEQLRATLDVERERSADRRKDQALDLAKNIGMGLWRQHIGEQDPKLAALVKAVHAIPRDSYAVLFKMGVLPPEAEAALKVGLDWKDEPAEASTDEPV